MPTLTGGRHHGSTPGQIVTSLGQLRAKTRPAEGCTQKHRETTRWRKPRDNDAGCRWVHFRSRPCKRGNAERTVFEPADQVSPVTDLANRRFRPLSHLSE